MSTILRLYAEKEGKTVILAEYRGPQDGLKFFKLKKIKVGQGTEM